MLALKPTTEMRGFIHGGPKVNIEKEAIKIGKRCGWDPERMASALLRKCQRDPEFRAEVISLGIYQLIMAAEHKARTPLPAMNGLAEDKAFDGLEKRSARKLKAWLLIPIGAGVVLGDATDDDLRRAIQVRIMMAQGNMREARFFEAILRRVPRGKRVREVLTNAKIEKIRQEVEANAAVESTRPMPTSPAV